MEISKKLGQLKVAVSGIKVISLTLCLLAILAVPKLIHAQVQNGTITGTVTDPKGAVVQGAAVTVTQTSTNLSMHGETNGEGIYSFPQLLPGEYSVAVEKPGFRRAEASITLTVGQVMQVNLALTVGSETTTITVGAGNSADLDTQTSDLGYTVQSKQVNDMPLNGRNPYGLAALTAGIATGQSFGVGLAVIRGSSVASASNNISSNGGIPGSNEILLDGVSIVVCCQGQPAVVPSAEVVSQFQVLTSDPPAEYGRTSGAVLNIATKSGTNQLRGEAYNFLRNDKLDAANFFTKRSGIYPYPGHNEWTAPHRENQFGVVVGGPVVLPRIYNGKDKTFFTFGYEGIRNLDPAVGTLTVPTALMREGIFTEAPAQVYNATSYNPSTGLRTPVAAANCNGTSYAAGYCIPSSEWNPAAKAMMAFLPAPNLSGVANNYEYVENQTDDENQYNFRIDHNFSDKQRTFIRGTRDLDEHYSYDPLSNTAGGLNGWNDAVNAWLFAIGHVWTLSPSTLFQFSYGFARQTNIQIFNNFYSYDAANYGFSSQFLGEEQVKGLPYISFTGGLENLSFQASFNNWAHYTHSLNASALLQRGKHSIAIGYEGRMILENVLGLNNPTGALGFNTQFTGGPSPNASLPSGQSAFDSWAAFLLGYPGTGTINRQTQPALNQWVTGLYLQDNWHLAERLTLNLGVRWDVETGFGARHNRWGDFSPSLLNPVSSQVGYNIPGGVLFLGANGNPSRMWPTFYHTVAPRLGFSYGLTQKTVVRGGYGILYLPSSERAYTSAIGYSQTTNIATSANGFTPVVTLDNPFPSGVELPLGASAGAGADNGTSIAGLEYNNPISYQQQWNFGVERSLARDMSFSINYVGSHGVDLPYAVRPNDLLPNYFGAVGSTSQVAYLEGQVANPFSGATGIAPGSLLLNSTVQRAQLLTAFPEYSAGAINSIANSSVGIAYLDHASASYNALQANWVVHRANGLVGTINYTWSKSIGNATDATEESGSHDPTGDPGFQDYYLIHQYERSTLTDDFPQRIVGAVTYPLPFGMGKTFGSCMAHWADELAGGWTLTSIIDVYSGFPSGLTVTGNPAFSGSRPMFVPGVNPLTSGSTHNRLGGAGQSQNYFNKAAFALPQSFQLGDVPRLAAGLRGPLSFDDNVSLIKYFPIHEDLGIEIRGEAFNVLNKVDFGIPSSTFGSSSFGNITSQYNLPRNIQLGAKVQF